MGAREREAASERRRARGGEREEAREEAGGRRRARGGEREAASEREREREGRRGLGVCKARPETPRGPQNDFKLGL